MGSVKLPIQFEQIKDDEVNVIYERVLVSDKIKSRKKLNRLKSVIQSGLSTPESK